jgi:hypothetical protein
LSWIMTAGCSNITRESGKSQPGLGTGQVTMIVVPWIGTIYLETIC